MLATLGVPPVGENWACEMKWDGQRIIASNSDDATHLWSRNGNLSNNYFPEMVDALEALLAGREVIVDGEIVALDSKGRPNFSRLQNRMHVVKPTAELRRTTPVAYYVFDVLQVDGESTLSLPYLERRAVLANLGLSGPQVLVPPHWVGVDGQAMLAVAQEHGLEGILSKRVESTYRPGSRSPSWIKTPLRKNTEAIIAGWVPGTGMHHNAVGSLILAAYDDTGALEYIGNAGTGLPPLHAASSATNSRTSNGPRARSQLHRRNRSPASHTGSNLF
jgi:bifunctional non-homologous end joining protein LigD